MRVFDRKRTLRQLAMRWADGGGDPAPADPKPADPKPTDPKPADPPAKTYTEAEVEAARTEAVAAYKAHLEEAKDYDKMTAEEKVAYLEARAADDKLTAYAAQKLSAEKLPAELSAFAKGKNEADTDERVKSLKAVIAKAVQDGVDARFKGNHFVPRSSASGSPETKPSGFVDLIHEAQAKRN